MENIKKKLHSFRYFDEIIYKDNALVVSKKGVLLLSEDLFFVDMAFRVYHNFIFAISAPKYDVKGILELDLIEYHTLNITSFANKFNIEIKTEFDRVVKSREYGMRKIYLEDFDSSRYILRVGFPDFPSCPYGHRFKSLGYDLQNKEYVRFDKKILKNNLAKIEEYKEL